MNYRQLRSILPSISTIPTLGGKAEVRIHNPAYGDLIAINSKGNSYTVSASDWQNASVIRSRNPRNPWASAHYNGISAFFSYGLIHAAALLRYIEEEGVESFGEKDSSAMVETI